jgi:Fe2+ or Zn2+ uptake regulation protein
MEHFNINKKTVIKSVYQNIQQYEVSAKHPTVFRVLTIFRHVPSVLSHVSHPAHKSARFRPPQQ